MLFRLYYEVPCPQPSKRGAMKKKPSAEEIRQTIMRIIEDRVPGVVEVGSTLIKELRLGTIRILLLALKIESELEVKADSAVVDKMAKNDATVADLIAHFTKCAELDDAA